VNTQGILQFTEVQYSSEKLLRCKHDISTATHTNRNNYQV